MNRLAIAAVGLALVVGVTTGCRSSGYSQAEVEGTVAASLTASAEHLIPTPTPSPLLTESIVLSQVLDFVLDKCIQPGTTEERQNVCMAGAGFYPFDTPPNCDVAYYHEHDSWRVTCRGNPFKGVTFRGRHFYLVDDHTGHVTEVQELR
jgi:hypothetical protein